MKSKNKKTNFEFRKDRSRVFIKISPKKRIGQLMGSREEIGIFTSDEMMYILSLGKKHRVIRATARGSDRIEKVIGKIKSIGLFKNVKGAIIFIVGDFDITVDQTNLILKSINFPKRAEVIWFVKANTKNKGTVSVNVTSVF